MGVVSCCGKDLSDHCGTTWKLLKSGHYTEQNQGSEKHNWWALPLRDTCSCDSLVHFQQGRNPSLYEALSRASIRVRGDVFTATFLVWKRWSPGP